MVTGFVTCCVITFGVKARSISGARLGEGCQALAAVRGLGAELKYKCSTHQGRRGHLKALAEGASLASSPSANASCTLLHLVDGAGFIGPLKMMAPRKIRLLGLHGKGTSARIMKTQIKPIIDALGGILEVDFLDGGHVSCPYQGESGWWPLMPLVLIAMLDKMH